MAEQVDTDVCVIGGGAGGLSFAAGAAQMGAPGTASAGSYRGTAGRAMGGHGNPNFKDPRNKKPGLFDKMRSAVQSATSSGGARTTSCAACV